MAGKFYAVKVGRVPGIYNTWAECDKMVKGYKGAVFKSFTSKEEAFHFVSGDDLNNEKNNAVNNDTISNTSCENAYAFVDGSFNQVTGVYGYGGFVVANGEKYIVQGNGNDPEMASMRNVAGEVLGSMAAITKAIELKLPSISIYYDYMGIEMWAKGLWKRNKKGTIKYHEFIKENEKNIIINFVKVKGHSGVDGNEEADYLAKKAVGI